MGPTSSYSVEEVRALVEGYCKLREAVTASPRRLWLLTRVLDLVRACRSAPLTPDQREALGLCGVLGLTRREAAAFLGVDKKTVDRRWENGTLALTTWLNGGEANQ